MKFVILFALFVVLKIFSIKCDIPTHCLQHQIVGEWIFYQTEAVPKSLSQLYQHKCGISDHTRVESINQSKMDKSLFINSFQINLNKDHSANISKHFEGFSRSKVNFFGYLFL